MSERLIPVTSEGELRVGMIVVAKRRYDWPRGVSRHRAMLIGPDNAVTPGHPGPCAGWKILPEFGNYPGTTGGFCPHIAIAEGRLFRVDDGLDESRDELERMSDELESAVRKVEHEVGLMPMTVRR